MFGVRAKLSLKTFAIASWWGLYLRASETTFTPLLFALAAIAGLLALAALWVKA